jgi:transposase
LAKKYMKPKQVYQILERDHEYPLSYSSFKRYMNIKYPKQPRNCLRIEVKAAEEAQVDFGSAGMMYEPEMGRTRRAHAFILTLSYSRLPYVEFVFDQGQVTWVKCHMHAFEFFGGIPERIALDNLKSGILRPNTYDPVFNRAYAKYAKHYGFIIDPAKIAKGKHKGKVERKVPVIRQQFLTSYDFRDLMDASEKVRNWCLHDYGMQVHGTTKRKPSEVFNSRCSRDCPRSGLICPYGKRQKFILITTLYLTRTTTRRLPDMSAEKYGSGENCRTCRSSMTGK